MPDTRPGIQFNEEWICYPCLVKEQRSRVDWKKRWDELEELANRYRGSNGDNYDCIITVSSGKDSNYQVYTMKQRLGMNPLLAIVCATLLGGMFCTVVLLPCLPLRGVYFAIVTLMYPLLLARVIEALDILGGTDGILGIDNFPNALTEQYWVIVVTLLFLFALRRLVNTDLGLVFRAVKDNDQAVRASAMNITHYKALAVLIASSIGCMAGACLVHIYMWAGISTFALDFSVLPIAATVIGGSGTLVGPVLGCLILVPISELLRDFGTLRIVFYSLILLGFIVFRSEGLMIYGQRKYQQFERWTDI